MASRLRIRLQFDSTPVHYARQCWFLFDPGSCRLVGDVAHLVARHFGLEQETGIQLYMDGFLVPTNESAGIIRDNDVIQVKTTEPTTDAEMGSSPVQDGSVEKPHKTARLTSSPVTTKRKKEKRKKEKENRRESHKTSKSAVQEAPRSAEISISSTNDSSVLHAASEKTGGSGTSTPRLQNSQGRDKESHRAPNSTPERRAGKLHAVKTRSSSGATHTKFCSSDSDSEPEQLPTRFLHPSRGSPVCAQKTTPQKHFPSVVGGPSDMHTTRSMIYVRSAELNTGGQQGESSLQHTSGAQNQSGENDPRGKTSGSEQAGSEETRASRTAITEPAITEPVITEPAITEPAITEPAITQPAITQELVTVTDYSVLPDLYAAPRVGDRIAFKVLELSSNYSPVISEYKEAVVLAYDSTAKTMRVAFTGSTMQRERQRAAKRASGRFFMEKAAIETEECPVEVELSWDSLVEPKLIP